MTQLTIEFKFSDPQTPMILFIDGHSVTPDETGKAVYTTEIVLPAKLYLDISGKRKNDTILDAQGNIVKDKCITIEDVRLDGISPNINYLKKWPRLMVGGKGSNQIVYSNYFGFNGIAELEFEGSNVFQWLLRTNKFRDHHWNTN